MSLNPMLRDRIRKNLIRNSEVIFMSLEKYLRDSQVARTIIKASKLVCETTNMKNCKLTISDISEMGFLRYTSVQSVMKFFVAENIAFRQSITSRKVNYVFDFSELGKAKECFDIIQRIEKEHADINNINDTNDTDKKTANL